MAQYNGLGSGGQHKKKEKTKLYDKMNLKIYILVTGTENLPHIALNRCCPSSFGSVHLRIVKMNIIEKKSLTIVYYLKLVRQSFELKSNLIYLKLWLNKRSGGII
jgi:hypothetical protein